MADTPTFEEELERINMLASTEGWAIVRDGDDVRIGIDDDDTDGPFASDLQVLAYLSARMGAGDTLARRAHALVEAWTPSAAADMARAAASVAADGGDVLIRIPTTDIEERFSPLFERDAQHAMPDLGAAHEPVRKMYLHTLATVADHLMDENDIESDAIVDEVVADIMSENRAPARMPANEIFVLDELLVGRVTPEPDGPLSEEARSAVVGSIAMRRAQIGTELTAYLVLSAHFRDAEEPDDAPRAAPG